MDQSKNDLVRVFVKGGVLSPADMRKIVVTAQELGARYIHFGSRQDLLFPIKEDNKTKLRSTFEYIKTDYSYNQQVHQNIVTSYIAESILPTTSWLHIDIYHYLNLDLDFKPTLQINITDPKQTLVPLFTGHINFVASEMEHYWYLYLRFSKNDSQIQRWPALVSNDDIPVLARFLDKCSRQWESLTIPDLFDLVNDKLQINSKNIESELKLPEGIFPYYEGFHKMEGDSYWLGLYWRNNKYDIEFIRSLCDMCLSTDTSQQIVITPWKSFIVKNIRWRERLAWEKLLGKFGINIRHSSVELNWHLPLLDQKALNLKNYLVKVFDKNDISTYGLTFSVKINPMVLFTSVVIEQNKASKFEHRYDLANTYNILYSRKFNPNSNEYITYADDVEKEDLAPLLMELSKEYYRQLEISPATSVPKSATEPELITVYQCKSCLTVYDETFGDPFTGIEAGVSFGDLPDDYLCSLCEGPKADFAKSEITLQ